MIEIEQYISATDLIAGDNNIKPKYKQCEQKNKLNSGNELMIMVAQIQSVQYFLSEKNSTAGTTTTLIVLSTFKLVGFQSTEYYKTDQI